ncbi:MAG: O-antigen ligase family protein [Bacteroidales bacterium]|jgi:hypothetical protein|nr:O-antigen ligase family protein [Bacteroidales bacterium]
MEVLKKTLFLKWFDFITLSFCIVGMLFSPFINTIALSLCVLRILVFGDIQSKINKIKNNLLLLIVLTSLFLIEIIGLLWTKDLNNGLGSIVHQISFLIIPIYICIISPIDKDIIKMGVIVYLTTIFIGTLYGTINYFSSEYPDPRQIIPFAGHISFGINICFAFAILSIFIFRHKKEKKSIIALCFLIWLLFFISIAQMVTSFAILFIMAIVCVFSLLRKKNTKHSILFSLLIICPVLILGVWIGKEYYNYFHPKEAFNVNLNQKTKQGNAYININDKFIENGYLVNKYVCHQEVNSVWQKKAGCSIDDSCNDNGVKYTYSFLVYRYLNSKGLRKDSVGMSQLSNEDINNIKHGIANVVYTERFSLKPRLYTIFYEFERFSHSGSVKNMSIIQRYALNKNAIQVIGKNLFFGVGTGDITNELNNELKVTFKELCSFNQDPHNSFLYIMTGYGLFGLLVLLTSLFYPPFKMNMWNNPYFIAFFVIVLSNMFSVSSIRLLSSMMFYSLFYSILLFNKQIK